MRLASKLTGYEIHFEEAEISDLDEAIRRAAKEEAETPSRAKEEFEKLFRHLSE